MVNWFLSVLVYKDVLTEDEAKHLSEELGKKIYEQRFTDAYKTISTMLDDFNKLK